MQSLSSNKIIGTYDYEIDTFMKEPITPTQFTGIDQGLYQQWVEANKPEYKSALNELGKKIVHISYPDFREALGRTIRKFKELMPQLSCFTSLVQPGKSQKWVSEIAIQQNLRSSAYVCLGEEGANNLSFALETIPAKDHRFEHVVIADDGSFSGNQMANNISAAHKIFQKKFGKPSTFHILIPFITKTAEDKIRNLKEKGVKVCVYTEHQMPTIGEQISKRHFKQVSEILWPHLNENERIIRANSTALYWFDHKIPNAMSFPETLAKGQVTKSKQSQSDQAVRFMPIVIPPYQAQQGCVPVA